MHATASPYLIAATMVTIVPAAAGAGAPAQDADIQTTSATEHGAGGDCPETRVENSE